MAMKKEVACCILLIFISFANAQDIIEISGRAVSQSLIVNVSVFVNATTPSLTLHSPKNITYLTPTSIMLNYSVSGEQAKWYNLDGAQNISLSSSPIFFNTSEGSHSLFLFANGSNGTLVQRNVSFYVNATRLIINYTSYKDKGNSTQFDQYGLEELQNLTNIVFELPQYGKIAFTAPINVTNAANGTMLDFNAYINTSANFIEVKTLALSAFNVSATLTLYNLSFSNPRIVRDGAVCSASICAQPAYANNTLVFNVTHFTAYSAEETPSSESGSSVSGGGGGGSSSQSEAKKAKSAFNINPKTINARLKQGETQKKTVSISNIGSSSLNIAFRIQGIENIAESREKNATLSPRETLAVTIDLTAKEDTSADTYIGKFIAQSGDEIQEVLIAVDVSTQKALFDVKVDIPKSYQRVSPGEDMLASVSVHSLGRIGRVDTILEYIIKNAHGEVIFKDRETAAIETQSSFLKNIKLPKNISLGTYILEVRALYEDSIAISSSSFIIENPASLNEKLLYGLMILVAVTVIVVIVIQVNSLIHYIPQRRKIDERMLFHSNIIRRKPKPVK